MSKKFATDSTSSGLRETKVISKLAKPGLQICVNLLAPIQHAETFDDFFDAVV
jgi:hypothetical protein